MPGIVAGLTGFVDRSLGKGIVSAGWLQRVGKGGAAASGGGNIFVGASQAGVGNGADTTEDTLFSVTVPPNTLDIIGRELNIAAFGTITASSATKDARIYWGSQVLVDFTGTTTQTGAWSVLATIIKTGSGAQTMLVQNESTITGALVRTITVTNGTQADNAGVLVKVTGQTTGGVAATVLCNALVVSGYN